MLWIRRVLRSALGITMVWCGVQMWLWAEQDYKDAVTPSITPGKVTSELPIRPTDRAKQPAVKEHRARDMQVSNVAEMVAAGGCGIALSGLLPIVCWALFGEWRGLLAKLRKVRHEAPVAGEPEGIPEASGQ